jgi:hypothetical protein
MEGFKQGHEVLLSCSHIFHRTCLRSFENFMKDNELTCPICRTRNYQKKITHIGSVAFTKVCAAKIQRNWRGYAARKLFRVRLRVYYKNLPNSNRPTDEAQQARRKMYYENEFSSITNKLNQNLDSRSNQVNTMLRYACVENVTIFRGVEFNTRPEISAFGIRSMDRTLIESQQLDFLFEQMLASRRQQDGTGAAPPPAVFGADGYGANADATIDAEALLHSPMLEYADISADFCEEAQQMWTGRDGC